MIYILRSNDENLRKIHMPKRVMRWWSWSVSASWTIRASPQQRSASPAAGSLSPPSGRTTPTTSCKSLKFMSVSFFFNLWKSGKKESLKFYAITIFRTLDSLDDLYISYCDPNLPTNVRRAKLGKTYIKAKRASFITIKGFILTDLITNKYMYLNKLILVFFDYVLCTK